MKSFFSYLVRLNRILVGHSIHDLEVMDTKKADTYIYRKENTTTRLLLLLMGKNTKTKLM